MWSSEVLTVTVVLRTDELTAVPTVTERKVASVIRR